MLLPCVLWEPRILLSQVYDFEQFEPLLITGIIKSKSEKIRKSLEQNLKALCHQIEEKRAKEPQSPPRPDPSHDNEGASRQKSSLIEEPESQNPDSDSPLSKASPLQSPKLFILKILIKNMP